MNTHMGYLNIFKKDLKDFQSIPYNKNDYETIEISEKYYDSIIDVINELNEKCDLWIDWYENETIPYNKIDKCLNIIGNRAKILRDALILAKKYKTFVSIDL